MKRLISIGLAVSLVICLALTGFAAPEIIQNIGMYVSLNSATDTSIQFTLHIDSTFGYGLSDYGVQWSKGGAVAGSKSCRFGDVSGANYTLTLSNLAPGTDYYICGYVVYGGETYLSDGFAVTTTGTSPETPEPSPEPTEAPTSEPTATLAPAQTPEPTEVPTHAPTLKPTQAPVKVSGVITLPAIYLVKGKTATLPAGVQPRSASDKGVTWSTKNRKIATVNAKGKVKGIKVGKTTVTVTTADGKKTAKCTVHVVAKSKALKSLTLTSKKTVTLAVGMTYRVKPKRNPDKATGIVPTYKSSNAKVAVIDKAGMITTLKKGKATITVKAGKKTVKCTVTVK